MGGHTPTLHVEGHHGCHLIISVAVKCLNRNYSITTSSQWLFQADEAAARVIEHVNSDFFLKLDLRPSKTRFSLLLINLLEPV